MKGGAFVEGFFVIGVLSGGVGVADFDDSLLGEEDVFGLEGCMFDGIFLKMAETQDAACEDGPEFCFGKFSFVQISFGDFVVEGTLGIFKQGIYFIECGAVLIFGGGEVVLEGDNVFGAVELVEEGLEEEKGFVELLFVIEGEFAEEELIAGALVLEEGEVFGLDLLEDVVVAHEVGEFVLFCVFGPHFKLLSYFNFIFNQIHQFPPIN